MSAPHHHARTAAAPQPSLPCYWADLCHTDFARLPLAHTVAVLPVAAMEQHGPHLPLQVDAALAHAMTAHALAALPAHTPALFLPVQTVGYSPEHSDYAGTLTLRAETIIALWREIGECVAATGIRKLLIFNTHGGNCGLLDIVGRDLRMHQHMQVWHTSWFNLPLGEALSDFGAHELRYGAHAGAVETSLMLAIAPDLVRMQHAAHFASTSEQRSQHWQLLGDGTSAKLAWAAQDYNPHGATGAACNATAAQGERLLHAVAQQLARLIGEISQYDTDADIDNSTSHSDGDEQQE